MLRFFYHNIMGEPDPRQPLDFGNHYQLLSTGDLFGGYPTTQAALLWFQFVRCG